MTPPRARFSEIERTALALWLIDGYLIDDPLDSEARVMWIQYRTGLTDEAIRPAKVDAWRAAQYWRQEDRVAECREDIAKWLKEYANES